VGSVTELIRDRKIGDDERRLLQWLESIEREGKEWRDRQDNGKWDKYIQLYRAERKGPATVPFQADVIPATLRRRNALLTENKPSFEVMPRATGAMATAKVLRESINAWWHQYDMEGAIEEMVSIATPLGAAGMSCPYRPDGDFGMGSCEPVVRDPRATLIDPIVRRPRDLDNAQYLRFETVLPLWEIQKKYPRGMLVKADGELFSSGSRRITGSPERASGKGAGSGPTSYRDTIRRLETGPIPRKRVRSYLIRDPQTDKAGQLRFPRGREIVVAGDVILQDHENPNWDGLWDLCWFEVTPDLDTPWGRSDVEALRYLSAAINRIGAQFVSNTILMGNSRVVYDHDALDPATINRLNNSDALLIPKKFSRNVDWQPPVPMPPHFLQFISFAMRLVDYLVGMQDGQMEGKGRVELRSGAQLEGLQNAAQVLIRSAARRLEAFLERFGRNLISRFFQYYQQDRIMLDLGPDGDYQQYQFERAKLDAQMRQNAMSLSMDRGELDPEKFQQHFREQMEEAWQSFAFKVQPLSSLAATKVARAQLFMELVEGGMMPRTLLLEQVGFSNGDELMQKAHAEAIKFGPPQPPKKKPGKKT
jgi:hypothetical protein